MKFKTISVMTCVLSVYLREALYPLKSISAKRCGH